MTKKSFLALGLLVSTSFVTQVQSQPQTEDCLRTEDGSYVPSSYYNDLPANTEYDTCVKENGELVSYE